MKDKKLLMYIGGVVLGFIVLCVYTVLLNTIDLSFIGRCVILLWLVHLIVIGFIGVMVYKIYMLKKSKNEDSNNRI